MALQLTHKWRVSQRDGILLSKMMFHTLPTNAGQVNGVAYYRQMFHILPANAGPVKGAAYYLRLIIHILPANTTGRRGSILSLNRTYNYHKCRYVQKNCILSSTDVSHTTCKCKDSQRSDSLPENGAEHYF